MTISDVLAMAGGLALVAVPALLVPAILRVRGRVAFGIAALVVAAGSLVALFTALSVVKGLTEAGILAGQATVAAAAFAAWILLDRPRPELLPLPSLSRLALGARQHPLVSGLGSVTVLALGLQFGMAVTVAPNNWDSLSYHLSRAAYWLEYHSVGQFPGGSRFQLPPPPNAEMLDAWTMSLSHGDHLAALVQWTALLGIGAVVFSGSRLLGFRIHAALLAALLVMTMPLPIMEATTTQNDLVVAFFVGAAALFGVRGIRDRNTGDLVIGGLALGLAVGTKGTALMAGPALAIIFGAALWRYRPARRVVLDGCLVALAGVLALGTYNYALNLEHTGTVFGGFTDGLERSDPFPVNSLRNMWSFVDLPALGNGIAEPVHRVATTVFPDSVEVSRPYANRFALEPDDTVNEDESAFGPTGLILLLPIVALAAVSRRMPRPQRLLAWAAISYLALFCYLIAYNSFVGRLVIPAVVLAGPLLAVFAKTRARQALAVGLALVGLVPALLMNSQKPLIARHFHEQNVFTLDRAQQQAIASSNSAVVFAAVDAEIGATAPLGYVGPPDSWDYPLFGEHLERRVVRLHLDQVSYQTMQRLGLHAVMIVDSPLPQNLPAIELAQSTNFLILARKD
jgi:4-amino-4-deoxy-L-arabinose transferase-like glycosyltransferase